MNDVNKGDVILPSPLTANPNDYHRRAVILIAHDDYMDGHRGFILNKLSSLMVADCLPNFPSKAPVYLGGENDTNTLMLVHKRRDIDGSQYIGGDIYMGGEVEYVRHLLGTGSLKDDEIKFLAGHTAWGMGEMSVQMKKKYWINYGRVNDDTFGMNPDSMYGDLIKKVKPIYHFIANNSYSVNYN